MKKFVKGIMYTLGGGTLVCVGYSALHLLVGQGDVSVQGAAIAFGVGCVVGLLYGVRQKFA